MAIDPYPYLYPASATDYNASHQPSYCQTSQPSVQFSIEGQDTRAWSQAPEVASKQYEEQRSYAKDGNSLASTATSFYEATPYQENQQHKDWAVSYDCSTSSNQQQTYSSTSVYSKPYATPSYAEVAQSSYQPASFHLSRSVSEAPPSYSSAPYQSSANQQDIGMDERHPDAVSWREAPAQPEVHKQPDSVSPDRNFSAVSRHPMTVPSQASGGGQLEPAENAGVEEGSQNLVQEAHKQNLSVETAAIFSKVSKAATKNRRGATSAPKQGRAKSAVPNRRKQQENNQTSTAETLKREDTPISTLSKPSTLQQEKAIKQLDDDDSLYVTAAEQRKAAENEELGKRLHQVAEQRRRWTTHTGYAELRRVVPECQTRKGFTAVSKATILARATMHIRQLREHIDDLKEAITERDEELKTLYTQQEYRSCTPDTVSSGTQPKKKKSRTVVRKTSENLSVASLNTVSAEETTFCGMAGSPDTSTSTISPVTSSFPSLGIDASPTSSGGSRQGAFSSLSRAASIFISAADDQRATLSTPSSSTAIQPSEHRLSGNQQNFGGGHLEFAQSSYPVSQSLAGQDTLNPSSQLVGMPSLRKQSSASSTRSVSRTPSTVTSIEGSIVEQALPTHASANNYRTSSPSIEASISQSIYRNTSQPMYRSLLETSYAGGVKRKEAPEIYPHQYAPSSRERLTGELPSRSHGSISTFTTHDSSGSWQAQGSSVHTSHMHGSTPNAQDRGY